MRVVALPLIALTTTSSVTTALAYEQQARTMQTSQRQFETSINIYKTRDYKATRIEFEAGQHISPTGK